MSDIDQFVLREEYTFLHNYGLTDQAIADKLGITLDWLTRITTNAPRRGGYKTQREHGNE